MCVMCDVCDWQRIGSRCIACDSLHSEGGLRHACRPVADAYPAWPTVRRVGISHALRRFFQHTGVYVHGKLEGGLS